MPAKRTLGSLWLMARAEMDETSKSSMMGRHEVALEWWTRGDERFEMLDAESSWAYRGESWRRVGEFDRAVADLEHALTHRPARHGSRVGLARTQLQAGRPDRVARRDDLSSRRASTIQTRVHSPVRLQVPTRTSLPL